MILYRKRLAIGILLTTLLCLSFWLGSRYPDLDAKAMMAQSGTVADTIAAFPILEVKDTYPTWKKIAYTSVNWANDNKKGMLFGVLIGGLMLTMIGYLQLRQGTRMLNTLYGFLLGSPLGVCVNCAAPVFKGVLQSRQAELAFAMMLSSPTMNVVVLTMLFSLFPLYMAITKVIFVLIVIFIGIPLISWLLGDKHQLKDLIKLDEKTDLGQNCQVRVLETWSSAIKGFCLDSIKKIGFIIRKTVPLMFLAGFLGASLSHLFSLDQILGVPNAATLIFAAIIGLLLPVPVAFDIILVNALFSGGMAPNLSLILLCTLGIFSIYSMMITWQSASAKWTIGLSSVMLVLSILIGLAGPELHHRFYLKGNIESYIALKSTTAHIPDHTTISNSINKAPPSLSPKINRSIWKQEDKLTISRAPFFKSQQTAKALVRKEGAEIGLVRGFSYDTRDYPDPFWIGRGTGSGDFNQDGWTDIVFGSDRGPLLYQNYGGVFRQVPLTPKAEKMRVYATALVDWNNDGWLDLFFTTYNQGNYVLFNKNGVLSHNLHPVPNADGILTISPSFADFDQNGWIDVFNGNMALGIVTGFFHYGKGRKNSITYNNSLTYQEKPLDRLDGETMASLASDLDHNGFIDIYQSNDFTVSDYIFWGQSTNHFQQLPDTIRPKLFSPVFSMSIDSGDLNNDGLLDYVSSGTLEVSQSLRNRPIIDGKTYNQYAIDKSGLAWCQKIKDPFYKKKCVDDRGLNKIINLRDRPKLNVQDCQKVSDAQSRNNCLLAVMWSIITSNQPSDDCQKDYGFDPSIATVCELHKRRQAPYRKNQFKQEISQIDRAVAYLQRVDGGYKPISLDHPGGWTWSSRIVDIDLDGWQDIVNAEGAVREGAFGFHSLLKNKQGKGFEQEQFSLGFTDDFGMFSYSLIDYDFDGDLDIISNGAVAPPRVFENQLTTGHSLAFEVRQRGKDANSHGLHTQIEAKIGHNKVLMREIKTTAGYLSNDAPIVYFGLGEETKLEAITIKIPGKDIREVSGPFQSGYLYTLSFD